MRDFLPEDVRRRQHVIGVVSRTYERYGFEPLETPALELVETLLGQYGEEGDRLIFKILKRGEGAAAGEADLALRYDLTVPLARVVAEYRGRLPRFFKRYQIQPVWRADRPQKGRFREFVQCDADAIGSRSMVVEVELLAAACDALAALGFTDFAVRLNHRQVLAGVLETAGVPPERHAAALVALDKLEKIGAEGVVGELRQRGVDAAVATRIVATFAENGRGSAAVDELARLRAAAGSSAAVRHGLDELATIATLAEATPAAGRLRIDASLARGLSYYTGAIFEIAVPDLAGSLAGGGRYDNLIGMFAHGDVPACGISLGLERILVVMDDRHMFPPELGAGAADVLVAQYEGLAGEALAVAADLRRAGLRVEVYPQPDRLARQFAYADERRIPLVCLVGEQERAGGTVTVKALARREQVAVPRADVATRVTALLH